MYSQEYITFLNIFKKRKVHLNFNNISQYSFNNHFTDPKLLNSNVYWQTKFPYPTGSGHPVFLRCGELGVAVGQQWARH